MGHTAFARLQAKAMKSTQVQTVGTAATGSVSRLNNKCPHTCMWSYVTMLLYACRSMGTTTTTLPCQTKFTRRGGAKKNRTSKTKNSYEKELFWYLRPQNLRSAYTITLLALHHIPPESICLRNP